MTKESKVVAHQKHHRILIVDDSTENIEALFILLKNDYMLISARNGEQAIKKAIDKSPDLILLDISMPGMDGFEVCQRLKTVDETEEIPIIFISALSDVGDETKGLDLGAVDYITKPFSPAIVKARIKNHLKLRESVKELKRLYSMALDANPMTKLPGNNSVAARIESALRDNEDVCVVYSDLDNFKAFNDKYGFVRGDEVLFFTCQVFKNAVSETHTRNAFIGHIGGDDFVVIVPSDRARRVADAIITRFDKDIPQFYHPDDVAAGCIASVNRKGEKQTFPLMSISMAGADLSERVYNTYLEVNDACAECKKRSKTIPGSSFVMERRR